MNRADGLIGAVVSQQNATTDVILDSVEQRFEGLTASAASAEESTPRSSGTGGVRRVASPVRLTLASRLGNEIDGAWWPRTGLISLELPELVSVLEVRLGEVVDINVNWSSLQGQPDLSWGWSRDTRPHVMTVRGRDKRAKLLIVPHRTGMALAVMVLRQAACLPIEPAHRDSRAFETAECIVRVARGERMFVARR